MLGVWVFRVLGGVFGVFLVFFWVFFWEGRCFFGGVVFLFFFGGVVCFFFCFFCFFCFLIFFRVRCGFIKIRMKVAIFIKTIFITNHFLSDCQHSPCLCEGVAGRRRAMLHIKVH